MLWLSHTPADGRWSLSWAFLGTKLIKNAYLEAKGILERAVAALDDGRDPADNIERIDGQLVELWLEERWIGVVPFDLNARGFPDEK